MNLCQCAHEPHTVRIVFDSGCNQTQIFKLCRLCQEFEVFRDFIITKEEIIKKKTDEVQFPHRTSTDTPPRMEMIT
jgi:hypothetical protein